MSMEHESGYSEGVVMAGFGVLAVVALVATVGILGGGLVELGYAAGLGIVAGGVVIGTYALGRRYGQPHSHAVAAAAALLGVLYIIALVYRLLTEFGA
ncbi:MAG: hypothetical protein V5A25_07240 [Halovenus sp.]